MTDPTQPGGSADSAYDRIAASDLFDLRFYLATYGPLPGGEDPLRHFLSSGLANGRMPSTEFDPLIYRLAVPSCGRSNPLLHYLDNQNRAALPQLKDVCRELTLKYGTKSPAPPMLRPEQLRRFLAHRQAFAIERTIQIEIAGRDYRIAVPAPDFFFDRLRRDQPFAFARLPHGFWDALALRDQITAEPQLAALTPAERRALACRVGRAAKPYHGGFVEGFDNEIAELIPDHRHDPRFFKSVAFKGFPTPDEDLFERGTKADERADRMARLGAAFGPDERLLDATFWKRLAYSGQLGMLPAVCRNRHVVLIGRDYFGDLDKRWELPRFTHVSIPRQLSQRIRWQLFEQLQNILTRVAREPGASPVLIMQCGGSLAYWLIARLFADNPNIFYIDLGQALDVWFTDVKDVQAPMWMRYYAAGTQSDTRY